jgi:hypothetical protein
MEEFESLDSAARFMRLLRPPRLHDSVTRDGTAGLWLMLPGSNITGTLVMR